MRANTFVQTTHFSIEIEHKDIIKIDDVILLFLFKFKTGPLLYRHREGNSSLLTLLMFGIRLAVKYTVEDGMRPWTVHQSQQGGTPGCSGMLHQLRRTPLQRYAEVRFGDGCQLRPLPAQYQCQRMSAQRRTNSVSVPRCERTGSETCLHRFVSVFASQRFDARLSVKIRKEERKRYLLA